MNNIHSLLKQKVIFILLPFLLACACKTYVSKLVDHFIPYELITISMVDNDSNGSCIWIVGDSRENNLFQLCNEGEKTGSWYNVNAGENGFVIDAMYGVNDGDIHEISFEAPMKYDSRIEFWKQYMSGLVKIETGDGRFSETVDLYSDIEGGEYINIYPFRDYYMPLFLRLLFFGLFYVLFLLGMILLYQIIKTEKVKLSFLYMPVKKTYILFGWIVLYIYAVIQYKIGIPNFLEFGDQRYYWDHSLLNNGRWEPEFLADQSVSFRGYLCYFFPTVCRGIGDVLNIDPVPIYFIFTSGALACLILYVLPKIYEELTLRKAVNIQIITLMATYLFFWNGTLTAILCDLFGAVAFWGGILYAIRFHNQKKIWYAYATGILWAVACSYRSAYQYGIEVILFVYFVICAIKTIQQKKNFISYLGRDKFLLGVLAFALSFTVISIPQMQINSARGHLGILTYSYEGSHEKSQMLGSANGSLRWYSGYPFICSDDQMSTMKTVLYEQEDYYLSMPQILGVYANSPIETLIYLVKKLFVAFDVKTNVSYPLEILWRDSSGLLFSFLNYFVLGSAIYIILFYKEIKIKEKILVLMFFLGLVLPQMFVHVEWRYFLSSYILMYYFFSFYFVEKTVANIRNGVKENCQHFDLYICCFVFIAYLICLTINA